MDQEPRWNRSYEYNNVTFFLSDFVPERTECRILVFKVVEQVIQDYLLLYQSEFSDDQLAWTTAAAFLFDDDYLLVWGSLTLTPEELLGLIDIDLSWLRGHVSKQFNATHGVENGKETRGKSTRTG